MSAEMAKEARSAMKAKAKRMATGDPHQRVDASSWTPPEMLKANVQTGERPISRRQFKRGGKVEGERAKMRADRKPRKSGGKALVDDFVNRDVREANEHREGEKHIGGFAKGGVPTNNYNQELTIKGRARISPMDRGRYFVNHTPNSGKDESKSFGNIFDARDHAQKLDSHYQDVSGKPHNMAYSGYSGSDANRGNRNSGGRAAKAVGGASSVPTSRMAFSSGPSALSKEAGIPSLKRGGKAHPDEREDEELIHREVKASALKRAAGGSADGPYGYHVYDTKGKLLTRTEDRHVAEAHAKKPGVSVFPVHDVMAYSGQTSRSTPFMQHKMGDKNAQPPLGRANGGRAEHPHWIAGATKNKGGLHRALDVPEGKDIPHKRLAEAEHSKNPHVRREADLAKTLERMHKSGGGLSTDGEIQGTRPEKGGRIARKSGGRAKGGKMDVNIIIATGKGQDGMAAAAPQGMAPRPLAPPPAPMPPQGMPMGAGPPPMAPGGGLNGAAPPMMRRRGGRTMEGGAGSGIGRLEKVGRY